MNEQLKELIDEYKKTDWKNLLREDLGDHSLKEIKPTLNFIKNLIDPLVENSDRFPLKQQNQLRNLIEQFLQYKYSIEKHRDTGQNENIINNIIQFKDRILEECHHLYGILEIQDRYGSGKSLEKKLQEEVRKYQLAMEEIERELKKIRQAQKNQQAEQITRKEAERYGDFFKKEGKKNRFSYWIVGIFSFASPIFFGLIAYCYLGFDQSIEANSIFELIIKGEVINKIFIFTVMIFLISLLRREYLALRHQYTLNRHRHNALSSHKEILSSIKETANESDKEISNTVLLELTKAMFSPQDTGFVKDQKSNSSENRIVEISRSLFNKPKE